MTTVFENTYTNKSNANRAAKKYQHDETVNVEVWQSPAGWNVRVTQVEADMSDQFDAAEAALDAAEAELAAPTPAPTVAKPVLVDASFTRAYDAHKAQGLSKCKALRATAAGWTLGRKEFVAAAEAHGIKATTASANWACFKRGEM